MFQIRTTRGTQWIGARPFSDLFEGAGHWNCSGATFVANAPLNSLNLKISIMVLNWANNHEQPPVFGVKLLALII